MDDAKIDDDAAVYD